MKATAGAQWLVERIARETHVDVLDGVANLLADIGTKGIAAIARKLEAEPTRDQAEVLLKSLGWIEAPQDVGGIHLESLGKSLEKYLWFEDVDIRVAACAATRILPGDRAGVLLDRRRATERDPRVLESIDEARDR